MSGFCWLPLMNPTTLRPVACSITPIELFVLAPMA
jgi:hypothetical protein